MPGKRYFLRKTTLAILEQNGHKIPLTIPLGAEVWVVDAADENQLVNVEWEGKRVLMFAMDLRDRGELMDGDGA